jgi:hypothetical protein
MAFDPIDRVMVLYGGTLGTGEPLADTLEYDGTAWTTVTGAGGPGPQRESALAYDPVRQKLVMLDEQGRTWIYASRVWSELVTPTRPPARTGGVLAWNPERGRLVAYGGTETSGSSQAYVDMWELDEHDWSNVVVEGQLPPARLEPALVALPRLRQLVLHAGTSLSGRRLDDTWLFQFRSATPVEDCANQADDDGDLVIDGDDPDCH